MKVINDNIWNYHKDGNYIVVTTNGFVKKNGECVMGRGIALQTKEKFEGFADRLGSAICAYGNKVLVFSPEKIITFPTKHNWWEKSDLKLIEESAIQLAYEFKDKEFRLKIYMPKPGCSNGKLDWKDVEPIIEPHLKDIVTIVDWK